jgi:MarR family transcriptional regulator, organic hydroperoxide resistance regulator
MRVLRQFRLVFNGVKAHFAQLEKQAGVGGALVWALRAIQQQPGVSVNVLATSLDVRQPTASNLVKALVKQRLVEVRRNVKDRRAAHLHLLPAGGEVLLRATEPLSGTLTMSLGQLDDATLARLEHDLSLLIDKLKRSTVSARSGQASP